MVRDVLESDPPREGGCSVTRSSEKLTVRTPVVRGCEGGRTDEEDRLGGGMAGGRWGGREPEPALTECGVEKQGGGTEGGSSTQEGGTYGE